MNNVKLSKKNQINNKMNLNSIDSSLGLSTIQLRVKKK